LQTDYPAACNAVETLLVHESLLETIWPDVAHALFTANVKLLCDDPTLTPLVSSSSDTNRPTATPQKLLFPAPPEAYTAEHLSLTLAARTVPSLAGLCIAEDITRAQCAEPELL